MSNHRKLFMWISSGLILFAGIIHVIDASDSFQEAAYKGWLFYANGVGALVAAYGMIRRNAWGWHLGFVIASISIILYVISRTIGLPLIPAEPEAWFEPLGILSLAAEGIFVLFYILTRRVDEI